MDAKEISEKAAKAKAARSGWAADMVSRVVAAGQSLIAKREQVRTASAPERKTPFATHEAESVARVDLGQGGVRDLSKIASQDRERQISEVVARARRMLEQKLGSMPIDGSRIHYMKADISRWDDHTGQPQTGRIAFQIPFYGPQGDPRTIYASVDLVLGGLMEPKTFTDGLNKVYAFDKSGLSEMFQGQEFDVVHQPKVVPEIKYTGPEFHAPDGIPGAVAKDSPLLFRKASGEMTRQASGEKPTIARQGLVRAISKEAAPIAQPISPAEAKNPKAVAPRRDPASMASSTNTGVSPESNIGYPSGDQAPGQATLMASAEVRELNWDGTIRSTAKNLDLKSAMDLARSVTFGGHDYVVEIWDDGRLVERVAECKKRPHGSMRFATAVRVLEAGKSKHEQAPEPSGKQPYDHVGAIMEFENGTLDEEGVLQLFQYLVDTGLAWQLQGSYGRAAKALLDQGLIQPANSDKQDAYGNTVPGKPRDDQGLHEASARGTVKIAGLGKVIKNLQMLDQRMISFRDLVLMAKQHGQQSDISFESAVKELAKAGIIVYKTAGTEVSNLGYRLAHAQRMRLAAPPAVAPEAALPSTSPDAGAEGAAPQPEAQAPTENMGQAQIAPPAGLDPIEFREFQALMDQYNNEWQTVHTREMNNIKNGNPPHMGIDYTDLQLLYDKIEAFQQKAKAGKNEEMAAAPADLAAEPGVKPAEVPAENPPVPENQGSTLQPEKGKGLAGVAPKMTREAMEQAQDMKDKGMKIEETDLAEKQAAKKEKEKCAKCGAEIGETMVAKGGKLYCSENCAFGKSASYDLDEEAKAKMSSMGMDPANPEQVKEFMGTFQKQARGQKFPDVCKNCKALVVPVGYSVLKEFKGSRLPFCGMEKREGVGFLNAYFRECVGYDPIVKDIPQKVEMKAPASDQTKEDVKKVNVSTMKKAEALPSAEPKAVREKESQTGVGLDIREWCEKNGHYAPAGEVHPTHDWCTLWNTAVENLVMLPSGAVIPKSTAGQSSESHGEGGPHQFGNTPNQTI